MTYTIYAPGAWMCDIQPAMESWECDLDPTMTPNAEKNRMENPGIVELLPQYWDNSRQERRGKGTRHRFDLTESGVKALRGEALYRFEFHGGNGNPYGCEEPDPSCRAAALALMERCDQVLQQIAWEMGVANRA